MPIYTFLNKDTNQEYNIEMKIAELNDYKKSNPNHIQQLTNVNLADPIRVGVGAKPSDGFRDILRSVKKRNRGSTIDTF